MQPGSEQRAFRILRLFGRVKAIRMIIGALTASLIPVREFLICSVGIRWRDAKIYSLVI